MKKITVVYLIIFILMLILPAALMFLLPEDGENTENRELSEFPSFFKEDGGFNEDFTQQLDTYISEHIGLRGLLVEANGALRSKLFGSSSEDDVILGRGGWLFYAQTAADYLNTATITERNAANIGRTLLMMEQYANENGTLFAVAVVPNKNTVYTENMPYNYIPLSGKGNYELVADAISRYGVTAADVLGALKAEDEVLYQRLDSHWDYRGALLGYRTIMDAVGFEHKSYEGMTFEARADWPGDLAKMVYSNAAEPDVQYYPEYDFGYRITSHEKNVEALSLTMKNGSGHGKLLMFRDSFCNTMQEFFAGSFAEAEFSRAYPFPLEKLEGGGYDVCVLEIVERNLINLARRAPIMRAPEAEVSADAAAMGDGDAVFGYEKRGGMAHVYGTVDEKYLDVGYRAYLLVDTADGTYAYEAFPIFEEELLGADGPGDNGFSAYLDTELWDKAEGVRVLIESNEKYYISGAVQPSDIMEE